MAVAKQAQPGQFVLGSLDLARVQIGQHQALPRAQAQAAVAQVPGKTDKLWVNFDNWFTRLLPGVVKGDYWVLYVSDDYKTAIVGDPSRKYLWLLSRTPTVNGVVREELLSKARQQGYDTTRLIWRVSDTRMAKTSK
mgnify:CR=1 FL=1